MCMLPTREDDIDNISLLSSAGVGNLRLSSACSLPCSNPKTKKSGQCSLFPILFLLHSFVPPFSYFYHLTIHTCLFWFLSSQFGLFIEKQCSRILVLCFVFRFVCSSWISEMSVLCLGPILHQFWSESYNVGFLEWNVGMRIWNRTEIMYSYGNQWIKHENCRSTGSFFKNEVV